MTRNLARWNPRVVMWSAIGGSIAVLGALLALGWDDNAWATAAGVLFVSCVLVCTFAGLQSRSTDREVRRAVARLAATREAEEPHHTPRQGAQHG